MKTPWGESQHIENIAEGIDFVSTAGHGGMKLSPEMNAKVPIEWREVSFNKQGLQGWYEEDCDVVLVVVTFPEHFPGKKEQATEAMKNMFTNLTIK